MSGTSLHTYVDSPNDQDAGLRVKPQVCSAVQIYWPVAQQPFKVRKATEPDKAACGFYCYGFQLLLFLLGDDGSRIEGINFCFILS